MDFPFLPKILDYSLDTPKYILTKEAAGERLSHILNDNGGTESLKYMESYGQLLADIHDVQIRPMPVKARDFTLPQEFFIINDLQHVDRYLSETEIKGTECFIHGDCHYANILWQDHKVSCLLDFELSGWGCREYDLAWALVLRPGQKFLQTAEERETFLAAYGRHHDFSRQAFDYYMVLFGSFFYKISPGAENDNYRALLVDMINSIVSTGVSFGDQS